MNLSSKSLSGCGARIAAEDDYSLHVSRKLYPNVDFSGLIYQAMGYPTEYFTVLFALGACLAGWHSGKKCGAMRI
ncbi:MAG: citrate/2-methylcitrate synthase [Cyanobacteriota/Melainabacteria group bacterium]